MAKKIIVLSDQIEKPGIRGIDLCLWFTVPASDVLPIPGKTSVYRGATSAENTAIANGEVIEEVYHVSVPASYSKTQLTDFAEAFYSSRKDAYETSVPAIGFPGKNYGDYFDGSIWTNM